MIRERLGKELLYFDGGMGTLLQAKGLQPGELPETWNVTHADEIKNNIFQQEVILYLQTHLERMH